MPIDKADIKYVADKRFMPCEFKQMNMSDFQRFFGIPAYTAKRWIHSKGFPAYKQGGLWYVDIPEYYKWRENEHKSNYKYAEVL